MTLLTIFVGFLAVAAWFVGFEWAVGTRDRTAAGLVAGEALVLTLLGALWFTSLGHGGWFLLFLLLGLLAAAGSLRHGHPGGTGRVRLTVYQITRYLVSGGLLALMIG